MQLFDLHCQQFWSEHRQHRPRCERNEVGWFVGPTKTVGVLAWQKKNGHTNLSLIQSTDKISFKWLVRVQADQKIKKPT
jgi:hypothetical protein